MNINTLKRIPLFSSLDEADLTELTQYLKKESFAAHHTIFWMDEKGEHLYIILSGKVQICYIDDDGREITLAILTPGAFFGELSLIDGGPHSATARAMGDTNVLMLDRASFYRFLSKHPQLGYTLMQVLGSRLRSNTIKMRRVIDVNEQLEARNSYFQRFIDKLARGLTSGAFLAVYVFFIAGWIGMQVVLYKKKYHTPVSFFDKPPTFYILGFFITLTSFLLTILILNSQRRQAENDRIRGEIEYRVNVKAQAEVMRLQLKMDQLLEMTGKLMDQPPVDSRETELPGDETV